MISPRSTTTTTSPTIAIILLLSLSLLLGCTTTCQSFSILPLGRRNNRVDNNIAAAYSSTTTTTSTTTTCFNWIGDLWEEVIEFSTYGPAERRLLKAKREDAKSKSSSSEEVVVSIESFQRAKRNYLESSSRKTTPVIVDDNDNDNDDDARIATEVGEQQQQQQQQQSSVSIEAFTAAAAEQEEESGVVPDFFDGYQLRDLLMQKWGVPLDVEFQRGNSQLTVYCTVLPVAFGSRRCRRHQSELDYLMHLQAVIEVLYKYGNLDQFIAFLQSTSRVPKAGVESVPFRLELDEKSLKQILGKK